MNQPTETNGPDDEGADAYDEGPATSANVPDSEAPTITVPLPEATPGPPAGTTDPDETRTDHTPSGPAAASPAAPRTGATRPVPSNATADAEETRADFETNAAPTDPPEAPLSSSTLPDPPTEDTEPAPEPPEEPTDAADLDTASTRADFDTDAVPDDPQDDPPSAGTPPDPSAEDAEFVSQADGEGSGSEDTRADDTRTDPEGTPAHETTGPLASETDGDSPAEPQDEASSGGADDETGHDETGDDETDVEGADVEGAEGLDPRAGFATMPLGGVEEESPTPSLGVEAAEGGWGGRELVESVYGPLTEFYERLDAALREVPEDEPPVGWAPHVAALRALREERVAGDWEALARFLVAPGSMEASEDLRLIRRDGGDEAVRELVKEVAAANGRALLVALTPERAAELLRGFEADPEVFSLLIETRPAAAEADSVETQGLPPVTDEVLEAPPVREPGAHGTVEFRPVTGTPPKPPEPAEGPSEGSAERSAEVTRAEPLPVPPAGTPIAPEQGPSAPETRVRSAALRPVGEAWRLSWDTEVRLLRRGLMWLEQWPRDAAALRSVESENLRRSEELEAEQAAMRRAIEAFRGTADAAERAAADAEAEAERLGAAQRAAEEELTGPREEAERLRVLASEASAEASALTRSADASYARCLQIDERTKTAQAELQAARQTEASLTEQLTRAREALPAAAEEAHRLAAADADAAAEGHSAYYRLAAAESALAAVRRKMTLAQRMHVASPPSDLRSLRAEVKARTREADEAARKARETKDAAENAERARRELAAFVSDGGARLAAAQEAQERLTTELAWLATERETAGAEHQEQARQASESVERATQAGMRARAAAQAAQVIEDRVNAARSSREQALATASRARADARNAAARAAETEEALERRTAEAAEETAARASDLEDARRTEAHSREKVRESCGSDPVDDPEVVPEHQRRAMARIEQLTGYLDGERAAEGDVLLSTADVVVGTPTGIGLSARDEEFDALIVADAGAVTDGEFLIGAVRARRWILVGAPDEEPPSYREYADAPSGRLATSPFERAATAAPHLLGGGEERPER